MAVLTLQEIGASGLTPTYSPAGTTGDEMPLDEHAVLHVKNGGASPVTVTLTTVKPSNYGETTNATFTVPASSDLMIRPGAIPGGVDRFRNANDRVAVSYSATTSVTVAAIKA